MITNTYTISCEIPIHFINSNLTSSASSSSAAGASYTQSSKNHGSSLLHFDIYRVISFPDHIPFHKSLSLAKLGFYFSSDEKLNCVYCSLQCSLQSNNVHEQHNSETCPFLRGENVGNIPIPELSGVNAEANRLCSFLASGWPKMSSDSHPVGALELASNGFYYLGPEDAARCAFCRLEISGWESGDTAEAEHKKWNPNCNFLRSKSLVHNIELSEARLHRNIFSDEITAKPTSKIVSESEVLQQLGIKQISPPKYPKYQTYPDRIKTYNTWPKNIKLQAEHFCEAGFYYTGKSDRVVCFHCGGGIKDWDGNDDPWVEHASWFPNCTYLNLKKSSDFVVKVQQFKNQTKHKETQECVKEAAIKNTMEAAVEGKSQTDESRLCKVCMGNELSVVFLPCGHMSSCVDCAAQLQICPICRKQPTAYLRAYLP